MRNTISSTSSKSDVTTTNDYDYPDLISDSDDEEDSTDCQQLSRRRLNSPQEKLSTKSIPTDIDVKTSRSHYCVPEQTPLSAFRQLIATLPLSYFCWDLKGPIPNGLHGYRYAAIATDKATRKRFIFFLKHKNELKDKVNELRLKIELLGGVMSFFKSDNGGEFQNAELQQYLLEHQITAEFTAPHTPHQNGIAERTNRTVCEMTVAMMIAANVPIRLWPYAMSTAGYILDRLPTRATGMTTTAHLLVHRHVPDLSSLRTWGCDAYAHIPDARRASFGARAEKGLFVGYDEASLAYLFYQPSTQRIYTTGHIRFNEDLSEKKQMSASEFADFQDLHEALQHSSHLGNTPVKAYDIPTGEGSTLTQPSHVVRAVPSTQLSHDEALDPLRASTPTPVDLPREPATLVQTRPQRSTRNSDPSYVFMTTEILSTRRKTKRQHASHKRMKARRKLHKLRASQSHLSGLDEEDEDDPVPDLVDDSDSDDDDDDDDIKTTALPSLAQSFKAGGGRTHASVHFATSHADHADKFTQRGEFICSTVVDATAAYASGKYIDKQWPTLVQDTVREFEHTATMEAIPDGGPDNNSPTYQQALAGRDRARWEAAIHAEIDQLRSLGVWQVLDSLPTDRKRIKALNHKWVLKVKYEGGKPTKYKARLTVMGCHQREGIDYSETFSPVANLAVLRIIIALGVTENFVFHQADVSNAFPNADLDEEVYMKPPAELNLPAGSVLRLLKALYGLKQASRMWHIKFRDFLLGLVFTQLRSDSCVFIRRWDGHVIIVVLYVDDMAIAASDREIINQFLAECREVFKLTDKPLTWILGMRFTDNRMIDGSITLDLNDYANTILDKLAEHIPRGKGTALPMARSTKLSVAQCPTTLEEQAYMADIPYRSVIGMLMYLVNAVRLDLSLAVNFCARYMSNPGPAHWQALQRILKRLQTVPHARLRYCRPADPMMANTLIAYCDSDHASDIDDRRSTSGHLHFFNGAPIAWKVNKQKSGSSSSAESEFKACHSVTLDSVAYRMVLAELGYAQSDPTTQFGDNDASNAFVKDPVLHGRMKHIDIAYHIVKDYAADGVIAPVRIDTDDNLADSLTKPTGDPT
jgi:transposase InsO family protein